MLDQIQYLLYGLVIVPVLAYAQTKVRSVLDARDAWRDAQANIYLQPGRLFHSVLEAGNPHSLCGRGRIASRSRKGVTITLLPSGAIMRFGLREWASMHPIWVSAAEQAQADADEKEGAP